MNVTIKAQVVGNYKKVMAAFNRELFEALKPPQGKMEIVEFTGSKKGDRVHMKFISPIKAEWISHITENGENDQQAWFIDEGMQLPWPLKTWKHKHIVKRIDDQNSVIIDDMTFTGRNALLTLLLYPAIFIGFYPRKRIYKQYFENLSTS